MKFHQIESLLMNIESNFSSLIDLIISGDYADDIIESIDELNPQIKIELLVKDIIARNYRIEDDADYSELWYNIANNKESADLLVEHLSKSEHKKDFLNYYLWDLNKRDGEENDFNVEEIFNAVSKGIKINHNKTIGKMLNDIENNFIDLIDRITFYDSIDQDLWAMYIIEKIKEMPLDKEIDLLIEDIVKRNYSINPGFLYSSIWYYMANSKNKPEVLIEKVANSKYRNEILNYFNSLNSGKNKLYDINMQKVIDAVNAR